MVISSSGCAGENHEASMYKRRKLRRINVQHKDVDSISDNEALVSEKSVTSTVSGAFKGEALRRLNIQNGKGLNMDYKKRRHCGAILNKLMTHPFGWVFNQPVDPVKLNIPDYFSIISSPMDLGTIKNKLERKVYSSTHQFAADVRLTYANAMRYNPPANDVHRIAKELNIIFNSRWNLLEEKWREECPKLEQSVMNKSQKTVSTSKEVPKEPVRLNLLPRKYITPAEKVKLRKDLAKLTISSTPPRLLEFLRKACLLGQNEYSVDVDIDVLDEDTLWNLHQIVKNCFDARCIKSTDVSNKCSEFSVKDLCRGSEGAKPRFVCFNGKSLASPSGRVRNDHNDFTQASSCDADSERLACRGSYARCSISFSQDITKGAKKATLNSDFDGGKGAGIINNGDIAQPKSHSSIPAATCRKGEDDPLCEQQLSPDKALRAVLLKSRFADTIFKAQQKMLLNHGERPDPVRMQREREKLEKKQQEEKERIEAKIKAAAAARMKAEAQMKTQREKEREAARLALQQMEKTVDIDENSDILKDLEELGYCQPGNHPDLHDEVLTLEKLGLFMKNADMDEEINDWFPACCGDGEEGEVNMEEGEINMEEGEVSGEEGEIGPS